MTDNGNPDREFAIAAARTADAHKASEIAILDVSKIFFLATYFVIATARSERHLHALADELREMTKKTGRKTLGVEGLGGGGWVLFDAGEIIAHLFLEEERKLYDLEMLWGDAPKINWQE